MLRRLVLVAALLCAHRAAASPRTVAGFVLPTRRADSSDLQALAGRLANRVAKRLHARVIEVPQASRGMQHLARAAALLLEAKVDEAAATYDSALDTAQDDPAAYAAPELIAAYVSRAQIALARGETARADALLDRLYGWDASFTPTSEEATPVLREAIARRTAGEHTDTGATTELVGDSCRHGDVAIVVRAGPAGAIDLARFDDCVRTASATVATLEDADHALDRLAPRPSESRPLVHQPWFWIALSSITVTAAGAALWATTRDRGGLDVAIHF